MGHEDRDRVVFYSKEDLASGYSLKNAEYVLENLNSLREPGINDLLELYNIKLYFDNGLYLKKWDSTAIKKLEIKIDDSWKLIKRFCFSLNNDNIEKYIEDIEYEYIESFWKLINYLQVYKKLDKQVFFKILKNYPYHIYIILELKQFVEYFGQEIRLFLLDYDKATELLLSKLELQHTHSSPIYNFPSCLSLIDKEFIISNYIEQENANLNYIRIIEYSKDSDSFKLSPKIRLKAKNRRQFLNNQIFENNNSIPIDLQVSLNKNQEDILVTSVKNQTTILSYNTECIDEFKNNSDLVSIFRTLFSFTNIHGIIELLSKDNEISVIEKISIKSRNEYSASIIFKHKNNLAHLQILVLVNYLYSTGDTLESLIESYVNKFINHHYGLNNFTIKFPSNRSTYLEKIRILSPEIDSLLKQYQTYVNEGQIDFDLISIDSNPLRFGEIKSLNTKKYVYINGEVMNDIKFWFFSDQSMLYYVEPFENKYSNLYDLLAFENVYLDSFKEYQLPTINKIIGLGYLYIDNDKYVRISKDLFMYVIRELNENKVISYWYYHISIRLVIDEMVNNGFLLFENTLFARPELNYFNYYLNKKEFTNGLDLRNKYLHGTNKSSEKVNEYEYYVLLKLIILMVIKIEDDLRIQKFVNDL
ncbi:hypothetical protein [Fibrella forsythiae]|uniref:DUF4209 domain-containing protein n=1 Tax=Fibrella forsythiae TaxID=2817061 RepID=A0ABS3JSK2_9BACT|nr:hypothetical protein [Fibrella forsythiae]MBO0952989.1 hypothetical protein [Fibrella forsythiae]